MKKRSKLWLSLSVLAALSGCATVPNTEVCAAKGTLYAGANCAETITHKTREMTFEEFIDWLEAQPERPDPANPGHTLPKRGAALCQSPDDWNAQKTALEKACRLLGPRCNYEAKRAIKALTHMLAQANRYPAQPGHTMSMLTSPGFCATMSK